MIRRPPRSTLLSLHDALPIYESDRSFLLLEPFGAIVTNVEADHLDNYGDLAAVEEAFDRFVATVDPDRKSTRLNSSHANISYAVFCLKKKNMLYQSVNTRQRT